MRNDTTLDERAPKYLQVAALLRGEIARGVLTPGDRLPPYSEAQSRYGTTKNTLDKAHAVLERDGLIIRKNGMGIFVAEATPDKVLTGVIGFVGAAEKSFAGERSPYWSPLVEGIQDAAHAAGLEILLLHEDSQISADKVDGVLSSGSPEAVLERLPLAMPCVSLVNETELMPSVVADDFGGGLELTRHLIALGHRRIACLTAEWSLAAERRIEGYKVALSEVGIAFDPRLVRAIIIEDPLRGFQNYGTGTLKKWLSEDWHDLAPTALFCHNDDTAAGAIVGWKQAGLKVPDDLSVVGFDGLQSGDVARLHLTTARVPLRQIGQRGVELLLQQIEGETAESKLILPTPLLTGKTSAAL